MLKRQVAAAMAREPRTLLKIIGNRHGTGDGDGDQGAEVLASSKLVAHRRPKSQTAAYFKSLRTMKRRMIAPTTYNAALPA